MFPDYIASPCRSNYSYFWSADYLQTAYHCTAIITIPLSVLTFYVIWAITPQKMRNMKWPLIISHCWSVNLDLIFTVLSAPLVFGPSAAGLPLGLLGDLGVPAKVQAYWGQVSGFMCGVNLIMLYENRHSQIPIIQFKIEKSATRAVYFICNYIMAFLIVIPFYIDDLDQLELRKLVLKKTPCPTIDFYNPNTLVLMRGGQLAPFIAITTGLSLIIFQASFFLIHTCYHLFHVNAKLSKATKAMQKKFLGCVTIQFLIPWTALCTPVLYTIYSDKVNLYNQAYHSMFPDYIASPCRSNYSYFWSADYMRLAYHSTAIITIPLSVLTFYVIWAITPSRMRNMKWPLIISHCWSVNLDLIFTVLSAPLVFGPSAAGLPLGLLGDLGVPTKVQAYWGQVSLIMCGICFVMLFENRQSQIITIKFKISKSSTRITYFLINYILALLLVLPFYSDDSDQLKLRKTVLELLIPWTALCTPLLYIIYSDKTSFYNQAYNNNAMLAMSTHGLFSSTCTLLIHKPYRDFVKELIGGKSKVSPSVDLQVIA